MTGFALRPDQAHVAAYRSGRMAVPAVPGAGKTTVLAYLAADLIAEGLVTPGRILIVTYTNSAVANFRSRIGEFLDARGFPRHQGYEVRTIHSLAMNIVRERPDAIGWSDNFTVMDEAGLKGILDGLVRAWIARNRQIWEEMLKSDLKGRWRDNALAGWEEKTVDIVRNLIQSFKSRRINPETALGLTRHLHPTSALRWAADVYADYQRELGIQGAVDFGDLMLGAHQLVSQDGELLSRLQQRWRFIFEDEAQDSYRLQEQVLRLLAGPEGNLVRVGDANQAIMGTFTSAEPDLFRQYCREPGVDVRPLTMAGRSSQDIIDLANELVRWVREEHPEPRCGNALENQVIQPIPPDFSPANPRPDGYKILIKEYGSYDDELKDIAQKASLTMAKYPESTMAVLLPTNSMLATMLELLEQKGAVTRQLGGPTSPERQQTTYDLLAVLEYLAVPHEPARLLKAVGHLMALPNVQDAPFAPFLKECQPEELFYPLDGTPPYHALYSASPQSRGDLTLQEALDNLARWLPQAIIPADELVVLIATDLGLEGEERTIAHHLALRVRRLLQEYPAFGLTDAVQEIYAELQGMGRFADTMYDRKGFKPLPGVIYVTTCHSAKGLEWDTVFVGAVTRGEYPSTLADKVRSEHWFLAESVVNPEALALAELSEVQGVEAERDPVVRAKLEMVGERLRLLYVAITRARINLMLSSHKRTRFDREARPALACQHLRRFIEGR